jgi:hypothetical protein
MPESDSGSPWTPDPSQCEKSDEAVLIQQIQLLALKQRKTVPADRIRELLSRLLEQN